MSAEAIHDPDPPPRDESVEEGDSLDPGIPLAVFLIGGEDSLGPAAFRMFCDRYAHEFPQILFVSIGIMDQTVVDAGVDRKGDFKGTEEAHRLWIRTREALRPYLDGAHERELKAASQISVSVNAAEEIDRMSDRISAAHPKAVYFLSKLVFEKPRWYHRWLYGSTSDAIRKRLEKKGYPVTVLPVVVAL
jgi:hypothetical protein